MANLLKNFLDRPPKTIERFITYGDLHDYYNQLMRSLSELRSECGFFESPYFDHVEKQILKRRKRAEKFFDKPIPRKYIAYEIESKATLSAVKTPSTPSQSKELTATVIDGQNSPAQTPATAAPEDDFIDPEKLEKEAQNADKNGA